MGREAESGAKKVGKLVDCALLASGILPPPGDVPWERPSKDEVERARRNSSPGQAFSK